MEIVLSLELVSLHIKHLQQRQFQKNSIDAKTKQK